MRILLATDLHEDQHPIVWTEQFCDEQLEELLLDTAGIYSILPNEVDSKWLVQIVRPLPRNLIQGILYHTACLPQSPFQFRYTVKVLRMTHPIISVCR